MELSRSTAKAKRACADKGYVADPFASLLCEGDAAGDPLLHRGYYARHRAVDAALRSFVRLHPRGQIVALGAGLDGSFWRLKATGCECAYFEVDSDLVVAEKQRLIRNHPILIEAVGQYAAGVSGAEDDRGAYRLIGGDLRDMSTVASALEREGLDATKPTLVLVECVLAYLDSDRGDRVIAWARATFVDVFVVCYDVVKTSKAFAKVMLDNFRARGAPLLGAAESLEDVEKRFGAFASRNVRDMRRVYDALIAAAPDELKRIAALEIFDDPDQFALIMSHYCLVFAASGACVPLVGACSGG